MFRAAYKDDFYIALRNALHAEVSSWRNDNPSSTAEVRLLWERVFDLEPKTKNTEATLFEKDACRDTTSRTFVPLHVLAAAGRRI
jgi:hypothetical protein